MNFFKIILYKFLFLSLLTTSLLSDNHDTTGSSTNKKEEPLPLNDPFVGDSSFTGGVQIISNNETSEQERKK